MLPETHLSRSAKNCPPSLHAAVRAIALLGGASAAVLLVGCGATQPKPTAQAPLVKTVTVEPQQVPLTEQFVGRLSAHREANVLARVAGVLLKRYYTEGTEVHAGQPLFQIDPAPYRAALDADLAALSEAKANATNAAVTLQRDRALIGTHLISQSQFDTDQAAARSTSALVQQAEANVESARINLGYTHVTSPISGIAEEQQVTEGALVGQGTATLLTTVDQINPIYVNFNEPAALQEQLTAELQAGRVALAGPKARVQLLLSDGTDYGQPGELDFRAASVDPSTGTIALRGIIPNAHDHLLPGMFVHVRLAVGRALKAFLVPQAAVQRDSTGAAYVLTVNGRDTVEKKPVETEGTSGSDWIVWRGLAAGERVIVSGLQNAQPGAKVDLQPAGHAAAQANR